MNISKDVFVTLHAHWISPTREFVNRYVKDSKYASLYWNDTKKTLSIAFRDEDSEVAKRYKVTETPSGQFYIACAQFLKSLNLSSTAYKRYYEFDIDVVKGNLVFVFHLGVEND